MPVDELAHPVFPQGAHDRLGVDVHDGFVLLSGLFFTACPQLTGNVDALLGRFGQKVSDPLRIA